MSGNLERGAAADLWRNTLSRIPTVFGRLAYLASLRDQNTGAYAHQGLAQLFGDEAADQTMRRSHFDVFVEWLGLNLQHQKSDLEEYLSELEEDTKTVLGNWVRLSPYLTFMPSEAREVERRLFTTDLEALLVLLTHDYAVACPDPDA